MDGATFDQLTFWVTPLIKKKTTNFREPISPGERLEVTQRYLASETSMTNLSYEFRMSKAVIPAIIPKTCDAIFKILKDNYLKVLKFIYGKSIIRGFT